MMQTRLTCTVVQQPLPPITSVKQPGRCFVPAVLQTAMEAMASACEHVGVRIRMDPMVAALAHEDSQARLSSTIQYNSSVGTPVAAGTPNSVSKADASQRSLRQAVSSGNRLSAGSSTVQRPAARARQQPVLLPPPSRALVLKEPVVPDKHSFFAQVAPEVRPGSCILTSTKHTANGKGVQCRAGENGPKHSIRSL